MESNYFEHFDLPVSFLPDLEVLRKKYLDFSKQHHPDYAAGDDQAYEQALMKTSFNNQAYKTLSEEFERVRYTLELLEQPIAQDDKLPPAFLMEMMDWNERIMEAGMEEDSNKLGEIAAEFNVLETQFENQMHEGLKSFETTTDRRFLDDIKKSYLERKYLLRLRDSINKFARL
ncbi:MAG: molecular chaperone HscB [Bacteroidia bacterium]